ncbi:hypothetical protein Tco_0298848 [Tanacetum coccineum]
MSDKKDEINKKNEPDWRKVEWTLNLVDYVYDKYGNVPVTDEMLDDLYNFAMMKESEKVESSNATEKIFRKLMVTDDMVEYVLEQYGKNWKFDDEIVDGKGKVKGDLARVNQAKQAGDDVDLVDADDVDLFDALDLENKVTKLTEDFTRLLKAKKEKDAKEAELKVNRGICLCLIGSISSDEGFSGDEDIVCFNDVKYRLTDAEIRMFKETHITSRGPRRQLASTSTRFRAPIASTTSKGPRCVLAIFSPNAPPPFPPQKRKSKP